MLNKQRSISPPFFFFFLRLFDSHVALQSYSLLQSCQWVFPSINHSVGRLVEAANSPFRTANGDGWVCGCVRCVEVKRWASEGFILTCSSNWSNNSSCLKVGLMEEAAFYSHSHEDFYFEIQSIFFCTETSLQWFWLLFKKKFRLGFKKK